MNWVLSPDGKQYAWVTSKYGWGLGFITVNGNKLTWEKPVSTAKNLTYKAGDILITVVRTIKNGQLFEQYTFKIPVRNLLISPIAVSIHHGTTTIQPLLHV